MGIAQQQPDGAVTGALYIESLLAQLTRSGSSPVLRYQGRDTTAAGLLAAIIALKLAWPPR